MSSVASQEASRMVVLDGSSQLDRAAIGGKAWGVNRMASLGLPVPPAFALPTSNCHEANAAGTLTDELIGCLRRGIQHLEEVTGRKFGGGERPLLVSVRSGAADSMPGMMDTILNLGLTEVSSRALAAESGQPAWVDSLRERFADQYRAVVLEDSALDGAVPADEWEQLFCAVQAVFGSWESPRAVSYRDHHSIPHDGGTAVTVQAMVFGNVDESSGTGVLFSRNPLNGDREPYGEWLAKAQGEDVVSGTVTPASLSSLGDEMPAVHEELIAIATSLEADARDVQDIEFTIESGRLWILQTRVAKRSPAAAVALAVQLAEDGMVSRSEALGLLTVDQVRKATDALGSADVSAEVLARGEAACPGVVSGIAVCDPDEAADRADGGESIILVRPTTTTDDVHGMLGAAAVVTDLGGSTSHAALVSRELGIPCVVGCGTGTSQSLEGLTITVDGANGLIVAGVHTAGEDGAAQSPVIETLTAWARAEVPGATDDDGLVDLIELLHRKAG